jgi:hypothetical protein
MTDIAGDRRDRLTPDYALCTAFLLILLSALNELDTMFNLWILIVPIMLLPTAIFVVWLVIALVIHGLRRRWRRVVSIALGPPFAFVLIMFVFDAGYDATWLRFEATKPRYVRDLEQVTFSPRFKVWQWGETGGAVTANSFYTLVFDESDKVARTYGRGMGVADSPSVQSGAVAQNDARPWISVRRLDGHFYLVCETYD